MRCRTFFVLSLFLVILSATLTVSDAAAAPEIIINTEYYDIRGATARELRKEMYQKSPVHQDCDKFDALTEWYVQWRYGWRTDGQTCWINQAVVTVDVKFTYPKWVNRDAADPQLKRKWDAYYKALVAHENGHKSIGVKAAEEVEKTLLNLGAQSECARLEQIANATANDIIRKYQQKEKEYDVETNHGMNDGAKFP